MSEPRKSRRRRQELEPLTYEEAANAPALTGLVSFLGLRPSDVAAREAARTAVLEQAERDSSSLLASNSPSTIQRPLAPVGVSTAGPNGSVEGRGRLIELTSTGRKPDHNASAFNGVDVHRISDPASGSTGVEVLPAGSSTTGEYQIRPVGASTTDQTRPVGLSGIPINEDSKSFDSHQIEEPPTGIVHGPVVLSTTGQTTPLVTSSPAVEQIAPVVASTSGPLSSHRGSDSVLTAPSPQEAGPVPAAEVEYLLPVGFSTRALEQVVPVVVSTSGPISSPLDLDNLLAAPETQEARDAPTVRVEYVRPVGVSTPGAFLPGVGRSAVYKAGLAQDGHSLGEQAVYEVLWREGKPDKLRTEPEDLWAARYVSLGYAEVAAKARINKKSAKLNLLRLIEKQAIEVTSEYIKETSCPRTYRVLSYREIVDRRKRAGMVWVVRNKAVTFVTPDGIPLGIRPLGTSTPGLATPSGFTLGSAPRPGVLTPTPGIAHAATAPGVETPTHINREMFLGNSLERQNTTTTSFPRFDSVVKALSQIAYADHNAVTQLVEDCSGIVPDVTAEEICEFVREKSNIVVASSTIKNPIGFLLATVPKCFVGKAFLEHREQKRLHAETLRVEAEAEAKRLETVAQQAVELITEPSFPEELKVRIRSEFIADPYRPLASYLSEDERVEAGRVWSAVRDRLQSLVNVQVFQTWFRPLKGFRYRQGTLKVVVPVREFMNLDKRYPDELNQAVARVREEVEGLAELNRLQFFDGSDFRV